MKIKKQTLGIILLLSILVTAFKYTSKSPVQDFLKSLDKEQMEKVQMPFTDLSRQVWHYLPGKMWPRAGIKINELNQKQKELAFTLLKDHLSESGFNKIMSIIDLENVLHEMGQDREFRDPEKYFIAIYGDPRVDKLWAWSFEGHHVSLNFTIADKEVSMTPRFLGASPALIPSGSRKGQRTLAKEDDMGLELINSMDSSQREKAIFSTQSYLEIVSSNATEVGPLSEVGIRMGELKKAQQAHLKELIMVYLSSMPTDLAAKRLKQIENEEFKKICFAWAGATSIGQGHYYRIQGKTFLIEFDNTIGNANHIHTVWRDFDGDFGRDLIKEHYKQSSYM